jgi:hypothetical protein
MAKARYIGIDPGVSPAICVMNGNGGILHLIRLESDDAPSSKTLEKALCAFLQPVVTSGAKIAVEHVGPVSGQGLASTCNFMRAWGIIRATLTAIGAEYTLVLPQRWKEDLLHGRYDMGMDTKSTKKRKKVQKAAAVQFVRDTYPAAQLIRQGCKVPDHNLAEAVCLAHWAGRYVG